MGQFPLSCGWDVFPDNALVMVVKSTTSGIVVLEVGWDELSPTTTRMVMVMMMWPHPAPAH